VFEKAEKVRITYLVNIFDEFDKSFLSPHEIEMNVGSPMNPYVNKPDQKRTTCQKSRISEHDQTQEIRRFLGTRNIVQFLCELQFLTAAVLSWISLSPP
jgi:hypothetical protein